ncbi:MAG: DegT/DnrJ/EryC1/StrS family aminotransferase [bacterium]|nr:DegT/DnrJ/EryC1/StrS family aminotransferase [bacterium]
MTVKFLDLKHQYLSIKNDIDRAIAAVIDESAFVRGKYVRRFEEEFAAYQQAEYCVGVGNGTDALEIALEALELPLGSKVLVPANSFIASAEAVSRTGHKVVFCDCELDYYTLSLKDVERKIGPNCRAILAVHLYGHPADMDALLSLAAKHDLKVLEDCAQAHGAEYKGKRVGTLGDAGTFSFYPGKNLGAYGDAGAIVTNDEALAVKCRMIANHGRVAKYDHQFEGRSSRLDGLQAAILSAKLPHLDGWLEARRAAAEHYRKLLQGLDGLVLPQEAEWAKHMYHLFAIRHPQRDRLQEYLKQQQIQTGIHYPIALPKLQAYAYLNQNGEAMLANQIDAQLLSLPMGEHLSEEEIEYVAEHVSAFKKIERR